MNHPTRFAAFAALTALLLAGCGEEPAAEDVPAERPRAAATSPGPTPASGTAAERDVEIAGAEDEVQALAGEKQDVIPVRFHGDWSEDIAHCDEPGHQGYDIRAREVGFFESRGIVQDVDVNGNYAAATLSEQYGDAPPAVYAFYMAIEGPDTMRIRYDDEPRIRIYRCPG
ncbi:hypothetical protein [Qipengyuania sp. MTN3-11]|uniref:hypothetical protein n=1 Tax=Qipengyuania sp. MTN3-11 TaxID=3056557 RepID=UPI0036F32655